MPLTTTQERDCTVTAVFLLSTRHSALLAGSAAPRGGRYISKRCQAAVASHSRAACFSKALLSMAEGSVVGWREVG